MSFTTDSDWERPYNDSAERGADRLQAENAALRAECERLDAEVNELRALTSELWTRDAGSEEDNRRLRALVIELRAECEALREKAALWDALAGLCDRSPTLAKIVRAAMKT